MVKTKEETFSERAIKKAADFSNRMQQDTVNKALLKRLRERLEGEKQKYIDMSEVHKLDKTETTIINTLDTAIKLLEEELGE